MDSLQELEQLLMTRKAQAYDIMANIDFLNNQLLQINRQIGELLKKREELSLSNNPPSFTSTDN